MVQGWLTGAFGTLMTIGGVIAILLSLVAFAFGGPAAVGWLIVGVVMLILGSFMAYASRQTVKPVGRQAPGLFSDGYLKGLDWSNGGPAPSPRPDVRRFPPEARTVSNDAFKLYIIERYKITKHDLLGEYVVREKLYKTLDEALAAAAQHYELDAATG